VNDTIVSGKPDDIQELNPIETTTVLYKYLISIDDYSITNVEIK
jgi:hypothetical protein